MAGGHQRHTAVQDTGRGRTRALVPAVVPGTRGLSVATYRPVPAGWACHEGAAEGRQLIHYFFSHGLS